MGDAAAILAKLSPKIRQTLLATKTETLDEAFDGKRKKGDSKCTHHLKEERGDDDTDKWCQDENLLKEVSEADHDVSCKDARKVTSDAKCVWVHDKEEIEDYAEDECADAEDDIEDFCEEDE